MAKESFREVLGVNKANEKRLIVINNIIDEYATQGYRLTLRQLYYQLVSRDIIPNQQKEYAKISDLLVKGRMAGIVDWDAIEDRVRQPFIPCFVSGVEGAVRDIIAQYRLDRQAGQETHVEVWIEKDALSGVLRRVTAHYHVFLCVNRGYTSCSAIHESYERILAARNAGKKKAVILYLGDHDPSGLDMIRDIKGRLEEFDSACAHFRYKSEEIEIKHIALTDSQIGLYDPPPNPAKFSDPRAKWYIEKYGRTSWEVDALPPQILTDLVRSNIESVIDMDLFREVVEQEKKDKERLKKMLGKK